MLEKTKMFKWLTLASWALPLLGCQEGATAPTASAADTSGIDTAVSADGTADATGNGADSTNGQGTSDAKVAALPIPTGLTLLGTANSGAVQAQMFAAQPLFTGMNAVFYRFQNPEGVLMQGAVQHQATMAMTPPHACPANPLSAEADSDALFEGLLIPQMPSDGQQPWKVQLDFAPLGGSALKFEFADLQVATQPLVKTVKGADGKTYVVALRLGAKAKLGKNPLTISVHRASADELSFAAVTDATVKLTTLMISMGHGSNGNINPVHKKDGLYDGTAAFSMPGDWRITFAISLGSVAIGSASFDLKI